MNGAFNKMENGFKKMRFRRTDSLGFFMDERSIAVKIYAVSTISGFMQTWPAP